MMDLAAVAQKPPISHLDINNVRPTILGDGSCYYPNICYIDSTVPKTCLTWEVPEGSGKETIRQHALWFGGIDSVGSLHLSALQYGQNGQDYWMGPLMMDSDSVDVMTSWKYHRIWCLTRVEIEYFKTHHGELGYVIPENILSWPAHGNNGYSEHLAPFVDVNGDGQYNPIDGDYPEIKGDQCLFFIFNDSFENHTETDGEKIGLEIHGMCYAFDAPDDEALNNTVFVNYKLFNRSLNNYSEVFVGLWNDWDIGFGDDDYVGCDVQRNSCFAFNGTQVDGNGEEWAYGDNPPVQVCTVLSGPDGLGLSRFLCPEDNDGNTGNPRNAQEYYNLLKGCWRDGTAVQYGGNGYPNHPNTVGPACFFMYPGDSDPENIGTEGCVPNGGYSTNGFFWTEEHEGNPPGNRRGLASVGPFDFPSGSMKELDYAMITVWKNEDLSAMDRMGSFIDHITAFYDNYAHKAIKLIKNGTDLKIRSRLSDQNDIMVTMDLSNGNTTFNCFFVGDKSLDDSELSMDGNFVGTINDMVGAMGVQTFWYLYAQHGWTIPRLKVSEQTLDVNDIGSIWVDAEDHVFIIGDVTDSCIYLLPEVKLYEDGIFSASWSVPMAWPSKLTHVSGAVHTDTIRGVSSSYDLLVQQATDRRYFVDGKEITDDGVYYCNQLKIQEHLLGYNIGEVESWFPEPVFGGSMIDWDRIFEFNYGLNVTCNTTLDCQYPFRISDFRGIIPQFPLKRLQYHSYTFIPKVKKVVNGHRVDVPFDSDDGTIGLNRVDVKRTATDLYSLDKQPERCVNYLKDTVNNYLVGMAGGCSLLEGLSNDSTRNANIGFGQKSATYGGVSTPNKFYPLLLDDNSFQYGLVDTTFSAVVTGYYSWFDPNKNDCFVYYYKENDDYILYVHAFEAKNRARINLPGFMNGMVVDGILEQTEGSSLMTERVVGGKLYMSFNTDENLANYIVVKLKSTWNL